MTGHSLAGGRGSSRAGNNLRLTLLLLSSCGLLLVATVTALVVAGPVSPWWVVAPYPLVGGFWLATGIVALLRRPSNRVGALLAGGGLLMLAAVLSNTELPVLIAIGKVLATMPLAVVVHLLVAFPSGRLHDTRSRVVVALVYFTALVLQSPLYLFAPAAPPSDMLVIREAPELVRVGQWIQRGFGVSVAVATMVLLARRLGSATVAQRRVLVPLYGYGMAAVLFIPVIGTILLPTGVLSPYEAFLVQVAVLALIPFAFAGSLLRGGFARTAEVEELGAWLGADEPHRPGLRDALAATLGDESLQLAFWTPAGYIDNAGDPVRLPGPGSGRAAVEISLGGTQVGAIVYDAALLTDAELVRTAGRVVGLAVDRERLTAELRASREALRQSRRRLVEAGDRRQERIARDLHDGLQNRLVVLALQAQLAGVPDVRDGIESAIVELRSLVGGIMPPLLVDRGLLAATRDLVDRMPLPVNLEVPNGVDGVPPPVQQTAFFVLSEALTNAVKHSRARELSVRLHHTAKHLRLEVRDDGVGGAALADGRGLRGIADRVDVAGGQLRVNSPDGRGTHLVAELPCAS